MRTCKAAICASALPHRLVYATLRPFLDIGLHALAIEIEQS